MPDPEFTDGPSVHVVVQVDDEFLPAVDIEMIAAGGEKTLRRQGVFTGSLTVVIADDETVQHLNRRYRQIDAPTDVLSFGADDGESADLFRTPAALAVELNRYLGDLIIAYPYAAAQAERFGNSIEAELRLLTVHGTLHLLGYDHANADEEAVMWAQQESILAEFGDSGLSHRGHCEGTYQP